MLKKQTRRWIGLVVVVGLFSALAPLMKMLVVLPSLTLLLSDWDDFSLEEQLKKEME